MRTKDKMQKAKNNKCDEFYTQYEDIELEMKNYSFENMVVYCNCDEPSKSNFYKYFDDNFENLKLKKLICTYYKKDDNGKGIEIKIINDQKIYKEIILQDDGDFRKESSINLLKSSDIIVTNPPFSLFREFVDTMIINNKKFIIIGNQNAITYKNIYTLMEQDKIFLGNTYKFQNKFEISDDYEIFTKDHIVDEQGKRYIIIGGVRWFTNIKPTIQKPFLQLTKKYDSEKYFKYDNYDAINVNKTKDIPYNYNGIIGVPITFLDKYNPEQFEVIKFRYGDDGKDLKINGKQPYFRILIKRRDLDGEEES